MVRPESWIRPTGEGPVRVGTGGPGSRSRFVGEIWRAERGVKSLLARKQDHRPWRYANSAASAEPQWQSRAAHVTAMAMSVGGCSGVSLADLLGVWEAARDHGLVRNRTDPAAWPSSGKDRPDKPMVKSDGGQRESDGVVVPVIGVHHDAPPGMGPDLGHASGGGQRVGMAGAARSNNPGGGEPAVVGGSAPIGKVPRLGRKLWAAAKQSEGRRFHVLYRRIYSSEVLCAARERVRANRGAVGVDRVTLEAVQEYGVQLMLEELSRDLRAGSYRPAPVCRVEIPKPDGRKRSLGIPTAGDRVAQRAGKIVLESIFEADFLRCSFGFGPKRSATDALETIRVAFPRGQQFVFEADIADFFSWIDNDILMALLGQRVSDQRVLRLIRLWLGAGVLADGVVSQTVAGTPQGAVISPLLANVYLHAFDRAWAEQGTGELVRYAGDFVVLCRSAGQAQDAARRAAALLGGLGLVLHPDKTRLVDLREGKEGFDFLGCHLHARMSGRLWQQRAIAAYYLHRWPWQPAMARARQRITFFTGRSRVGAPLQDLIKALNLFLGGWGNYLRTAERVQQVRPARPVRWVAAQTLADQEAGPQPARCPGGQVDVGLVPRPGPAPAHGTIGYPKAA
jgi:RNA-directed DNA polymerase